MVTYCILLAVSVVLIFTGKAISDITQDDILWKKSIFSKKYKIDSFFGSKEQTSERKDRENPFWDKMFHTILVFTTDIWHLGNFLRRIGIYGSILFSMLLGGELEAVWWYIPVVIISVVTLNMIGFHIVYEYILKKDREPYLFTTNIKKGK